MVSSSCGFFFFFKFISNLNSCVFRKHRIGAELVAQRLRALVLAREGPRFCSRHPCSSLQMSVTPALEVLTFFLGGGGDTRHPYGAYTYM